MNKYVLTIKIKEDLKDYEWKKNDVITIIIQGNSFYSVFDDYFSQFSACELKNILFIKLKSIE